MAPDAHSNSSPALGRRSRTPLHRLTPEAGSGLSSTGRDVRLGWRLVREPRAGELGAFELSVEATRPEAANDDTGAEHQVGLQVHSGVFMNASAHLTRRCSEPRHAMRPYGTAQRPTPAP